MLAIKLSVQVDRLRELFYFGRRRINSYLIALDLRDKLLPLHFDRRHLTLVL